MIFLLLFILELVLLFFLSRNLHCLLSPLPINLISFLFLPGIIIHELSHLLTASFLFVPAGDIEFMPQVEEGGLKLGSVSIGKTDPLRRFLIGIAPIIFGTAVILGVCYFVELNGLSQTWIIAIASYILFAVVNTMFSSGKDMEGALALLIFITIIFIALFIAGFRTDFQWLKAPNFVNFLDNLRKADLYLLILVVLDTSIYFLLRFLRR